MPEPEDRIVPARRDPGFLAFLSRLFSFVSGAIISLALVFFGLHVTGIGKFGLISPPDWFERFSAVDGYDHTVPADEPVAHLLARLCRPGPDFVDQCRLLRQELCNQPATQQVMQELGSRKNFPAVVTLGSAFLDRCDEEEAIGLLTAKAQYHLTDFTSALATIDRFPEQATGYADYASWRGFTNEKLQRFDEAAADYQRALYLFNDLSNVGAMQFYYVTRALRAAGRPCEAIAPLKLFVSFDPASRKTTLVDREIAELRSLGSCPEDAAPGRKVISLQRRSGLLLLHAKVNGVRGQFIIDTGASTVHLTREFAKAASVTVSDKRLINVVGVTGTRTDYLSDLRHVAVDGFVARNVPATVASVEGPFQEGIVGLLGQTYLSRFGYSIDGEKLTLRPL